MLTFSFSQTESAELLGLSLTWSISPYGPTGNVCSIEQQMNEISRLAEFCSGRFCSPFCSSALVRRAFLWLQGLKQKRTLITSQKRTQGKERDEQAEVQVNRQSFWKLLLSNFESSEPFLLTLCKLMASHHVLAISWPLPSFEIERDESSIKSEIVRRNFRCGNLTPTFRRLSLLLSFPPAPCQDLLHIRRGGGVEGAEPKD